MSALTPPFTSALADMMRTGGTCPVMALGSFIPALTASK
jgi:hypothetical protein